MGVADAQCELLLLGGFSRGQMGTQERLQCGRNFVVRHSLDVLEGFFCRLEGLIGCNRDHLGEPLEGIDRLLDLGETSSGLVVLLLFKETVP